MSFASLRRFIAGNSRSPKTKKIASPRRRITPILEHLESRIVPSNTYTVAAGDTTGLISAINSANNDTKSSITGDTITLTNSTYSFTASNNSTNGANVLPVITATRLTIQGSGSTLSAGTNGRLFDVASGASVTLVNMSLTGGKASGATANGGAIYNSGQLTLKTVKVGGNSVAGASGQNAAGGGIYSNNGSLTLDNDIIGSKVNHKLKRNFNTLATISKHTSVVGASNKVAGGTGGSGLGGGLYVAGGSLNVSNCTIAGNQASGSVNAQGGGLYVNGTTLKLTNDLVGLQASHKLTVVNGSAYSTNSSIGGANKATGGTAQGAGLYVSGGSVTVSNGVGVANRGIDGNRASGGAGQNAAGGGVYVVGVSQATFKNVPFISNFVLGGAGAAAVGSNGGNAQGGGLFISGGKANLTNCQVSDGSSSVYNAGGNGGIGGNGGVGQGGGIYALNTTLTLTGGGVDRNRLKGGTGGNGTANHPSAGQGGNVQGGGVFASASTIVIEGGATLFNNFAGAGKGGQGGNAIVTNASKATVNQKGGTAGGQGGSGGVGQGGGLYANGGSVSIAGGNNASISANILNGGAGGVGGNGGAGKTLGNPGGVGGAGGGGGEADGGGIYVNGATLAVNGGVTIATNSAGAGPGGRGGQGGHGWFNPFRKNLTGTNFSASGFGGNGGDGGIGGIGGAAQGAGLFATGSGLTITLGNAASGVALTSNSAGGGFGGEGGAAGKIEQVFRNGNLLTKKYLMGQGGHSGDGGAAKGAGAVILGDKLALTNSTIRSNNAGGGQGGSNPGYSSGFGSGIRGGGGSAAGGVGGSGQGGGLYVSASSSAVILNSSLADNNALAANGGKGGSGGPDKGNASGSEGYKLHGGNGGNGSTQQGGGLYAAATTLTVINSTIADNVLVDAVGGAGGTGLSGNGLAGVNGTSQGGGVFATSGSLSLTNDTIAWNFIKPAVSPTPSGDHGAGIFASNTPTLQNTIVALDQIYNATPATPTSTMSDLYGAAASSSDHNLIGDGTGSSGLGNGTNGNQVGTDASPLNPLFSAAAPTGPGQGQEPTNYGGLTPTLALAGNSSAIAAGNPSAASTIASAEGVAGSNATDQRGLPRLVNGAIDIGATEMQVDFTGIPSVTTIQTGGTITYTVTATNGEGVPISLTLTDVVPANTSYVSGSASGTGWTITAPSATNSNTLTATMSSLSPGATATLTFSVTVASNASGTVTDTAKLSWTGSNTSGTLSVPMNTTVTGGMASTSTVLTSSGNPSVYGQSVTFKATVSASSGTPTGNVVFEDGSTILGRSVLSGGAANFTTSALSVGSHSIKAVYSGDTNDFGSPSNTVTQVVDPDNTTTALASSIIPSVYGQSVTFKATVSVDAPGAGTPTGTVTFYDGATKLGTGSLSNGVATLTVSTLSVSNHSITADYSGDGNDLGGASNAVIQIVDPDSTTTTLTSSTNTSVYSQPVKFTATVGVVNPGAGTPTGTVTFYDGSTKLGTGTLNNGVATFTTSALSGGSHSITAVYGGDTNDRGSTTPNALSEVVNQASTTTALTSSATSSALGQNVTFTATVSVVSPGTATPTGNVDFVDATTGLDLGTVALSGGTASLTASSLAFGSDVVEAVYGGQTGAFLGSTASVTQTVTQSIIVLDSTANGALSLSGNSSITVPGNVIVDSSSKTALTESGTTSIKAASIQVVGGVSTGANATLSPAAVTGIAPVPNPLAYLTGPSTTGLTNYGSARYSTGSYTLNPGIYTSIVATGNASLTLNPGVYLIEGGGIVVAGSAGIAGSGVMIYNTSSNYPNNTGSYGGIRLSGTGTFSVTAATSGQYAGVVIFQPPANTRAITLSGNAAAGLTGTIYAPAALLYASGSASVNSALVVNELSLSGNAASAQTAAGTTADNPGSSAGQLLAGDVEVYVNNSNGDLTSDELARIQDAVNAIDAVTQPFGVTVAEVSSPTQANVTLSMGTSSAAGNFGQGVLGCYSLSGQITLIQGWNWYAGSNAALIGANQYDFETTVTHELGHALGLGESDVQTSAMYGTLTPGTTIRTLTTADLNIPYAEAGADAQMAAMPAAGGSLASLIGYGAVNGLNTMAPSNTSVSGKGGFMFAQDQVFAGISLFLSDVWNAFRSELSLLSGFRPQVEALEAQSFDILMSIESGALGIFQDNLIRALLMGGR